MRTQLPVVCRFALLPLVHLATFLSWVRGFHPVAQLADCPPGEGLSPPPRRLQLIIPALTGFRNRAFTFILTLSEALKGAFHALVVSAVLGLRIPVWYGLHIRVKLYPVWYGPLLPSGLVRYE